MISLNRAFPSGFVLTLAFVVMGVGLLPKLRRLTEGTTLRDVLLWASLAYVGLLAGEFWDELHAGASTDAVRFAACCLQLCPAMALLGVRRPHHRAWNVVVVSLWIVAVLPVGNEWLGRPLTLHVARQWFMLAILVLGICNYLPTVFMVPVLVVGGLEVALLSGYLTQVMPAGLQFPDLSLPLLLLSMLFGGWWIGLGLPDRSARSVIDRVWLDFRDLYGGLWALRVQERVNAVAQQNRWPLRLTWGGIRHEATAAPMQNDLEQAVATTMVGIMRRFVSDPWLAARGIDQGTVPRDVPTKLSPEQHA